MDGQELKAWRLSKNLTQLQLAKLLGVGKRGQVAVAEWENGVKNMGRMYNVQLEKLLELSSEVLKEKLSELS